MESAPYTFDDIVGLEEIKVFARRLALQDIDILLLGETGTGKELFASAIHNASSRRLSPFIVVNCLAVPAPLFESELFGYKKGAFTDACKDYNGKIIEASKGTLFLDEIGDLPLEVQGKFLRVLETKKVCPLGTNRERKVDVRFIFATNRNLKEMVRNGQFREDLYHRISAPVITIPPLRERRGEIPGLIKHLFTRIKKRYPGNVDGLTSSAMERMISYDYPGNVRELEKILIQAYLTCEKEYIDVEGLCIKNRKIGSINEMTKQYKARLIYEHFLMNNRNIRSTCQMLKISRAQLYRYLKIANKERSSV